MIRKELENLHFNPKAKLLDAYSEIKSAFKELYEAVGFTYGTEQEFINFILKLDYMYNNPQVKYTSK